ncbi:MAG: hypothetical protein ACNI3A_06960 [Desulfovibrio sp.]|uniref:hypothetical protein n=1 Tax=Desulfovibrio sp. 7SRBS1 TaxID=3378064 RepID=UPI003B3F61E6
MDWWLLKQLRSMVISDLKNFIPPDYFEQKKDHFQITNQLQNSDYISKELRWGFLAGKMGKDLFFNETPIMSARQKSASEVLMNLGLLAEAEAARLACESCQHLADTKKILITNPGEVASQIQSEQIPILEENIKGALQLYINHLTPQEAVPFCELLNPKDLTKKKIWNINFNKIVEFILKRVDLIIIGVIISLLGLLLAKKFKLI